MSLADLSTIVGLISGIAVVFSLVFLALQMRQTNKNQKALMQQGRSGRIIEALLKRTDPHLGGALSRAWRGETDLDPSEVHAVVAWILSIFWHFEDSFLQHQAGLLDDKSWEGDLAAFRTWLGLPVARVTWQIAQSQLTGPFKDFGNAVLQQVAVMKTYDEAATFKDLMAKEIAKASA